MTPALVDDQLLGEVLRGTVPKALRARDLHTTGCWYFRLCQAVVNAHDRTGVLSQPFAALPPELQNRAVAAVLELPTAVGMQSLRDLAPTMAQLRGRHSLNVLGLEALAAATLLRADVYLSAPSPRLQESLASEGLQVTVAPRSATRRR